MTDIKIYYRNSVKKKKKKSLIILTFAIALLGTLMRAYERYKCEHIFLWSQILINRSMQFTKLV